MRTVLSSGGLDMLSNDSSSSWLWVNDRLFGGGALSGIPISKPVCCSEFLDPGALVVLVA